jgi:HEXXH motif-containing protein
MSFDGLRISMDSEPTLAQLSGYAHPYGPLDTAFMAATSVSMARQIVASFTSAYQSQLVARGGAALAELLGAWTTQPTDHEIVWDAAFGQARAAATANAGDALAIEAAAALGLRLAASGTPARFSLELESPAQLVFATWLLPSAQGVRVESDGSEASIEAVGKGVLRFRREGARWQPMGDLTAEAGAIVEIERNGGRILLLPRGAVFGMGMEELAPMVPEVVDAEVRASIEEAVAILRDHAPRYLDWVGRMVRRIVPLGSPPALMMSSSSIYRPGTITMSHNKHPLGMAEILVHEATHEYCHMASYCGPVDDGSDTTLYYSPIRGTERPLWAILVAYHAVANIALLYRECRKSGYVAPEYLDASEPEAIGWLAELDRPLASTRALTTVGRALYEPLRDQLR